MGEIVYTRTEYMELYIEHREEDNIEQIFK